MKSEIEPAQVYHRLPERVRAYAITCLLAWIRYRVMHPRLTLAKSELSPEKAQNEITS